MDFFIVLILALLVGVMARSIFDLQDVWGQNGGKVAGNQFTEPMAIWRSTARHLRPSMHSESQTKGACSWRKIQVYWSLCSSILAVRDRHHSGLFPAPSDAPSRSFRLIAWLAKVFLGGVGLLLAALPLIFASSAVVSSLMHVNSQKDSQPIMQLFERVSEPTRKIPIILLAIVIAPLAEEFFFRGFLYGVLKRYAGALPALVFTGVAFAVIHLHVPSLLPLFLLACVLTLAYELSGSLLVPMAMHALFNAITLVGVFRGEMNERTRRRRGRPTIDPVASSGWPGQTGRGR
jgi:membrane protease YdiL (CAAX protease family)